MKNLTVPVAMKHHRVECRHSHVADIILQIGWETNTSHAEHGQLSIKYVLIRQYLTQEGNTGRKYASIKKYALNKHVLLLTRLYGIAS